MDDIEKIRRLVSLVSENELAELELEEPEFRIKIKSKGTVDFWPAMSSGQAAGCQPWGPPAPNQASAADGGETEGTAAKDDGLLEIVSPMVGTLYRSPGDGADPYVTVGDVVEPDTVVCIVEAMKVMNEVKAEVGGVVEEILVQNAEPVEYNQVLFLVRPTEDKPQE